MLHRESEMAVEGNEGKQALILPPPTRKSRPVSFSSPDAQATNSSSRFYGVRSP